MSKTHFAVVAFAGVFDDGAAVSAYLLLVLVALLVLGLMWCHIEPCKRHRRCTLMVMEHQT